MATGMLSSVAATLLPRTVADPIFEKTNETSVVQSLARRVPLAITAQTEIPVSMDVPVAGWVAEGQRKPVGAAGVGVRTMKGKKVALLLPVSTEVATSNPAGLYAQLRQDLPLALSRAFDHACIHGKDLRTGSAGPFDDYLLRGASSIELGTASQATGGIRTDLVNGEKLVVDAGFDFSGFGADPRLRPTLKLATDTTGRPLMPDDASTIIGYPAAFNRGVSGKYRRNGSRVQVVTITGTPTGGVFKLAIGGATTGDIAYNAAAGTVQTAVRALGALWAGATVTGSAGGPYTVTLSALGGAAAPILADGSGLTGGTNPAVVVAQSPEPDTKLRAIGGDWTQAAWGQGMDITIKVSDVASYVDEADVTHSAFQENLVLLLVEAYYGFVTSGVPGALVAYTDAA